MENVEKKIYVTRNYDEFKQLKGNRTVTEQRVNKIINSIRDVGYITNPIIVNEKMEVIDGQGRLQALKILKMPVEYIVEPGAGIEQCLNMNINQTNWNLRDYIKSYADSGLDGYIKLIKLMKEYPQFNCYVLLTATREVSKVDGSLIKSGNLTITDEQYENAIRKLEYLKLFEGLFDNVRGKEYYLYQGILYCCTFDNVDKERLLNKMKELSHTITPFGGILDAIEEIERIYNTNIRKDYAFIVTEYRRSLMTRMRAGARAIMKNKKITNMEE